MPPGLLDRRPLLTESLRSAYLLKTQKPPMAMIPSVSVAPEACIKHAQSCLPQPHPGTYVDTPLWRRIQLQLLHRRNRPCRLRPVTCTSWPMSTAAWPMAAHLSHTLTLQLNGSRSAQETRPLCQPCPLSISQNPPKFHVPSRPTVLRPFVQAINYRVVLRSECFCPLIVSQSWASLPWPGTNKITVSVLVMGQMMVQASPRISFLWQW